VTSLRFRVRRKRSYILAIRSAVLSLFFRCAMYPLRCMSHQVLFLRLVVLFMYISTNLGFFTRLNKFMLIPLYQCLKNRYITLNTQLGLSFSSLMVKYVVPNDVSRVRFTAVARYIFAFLAVYSLSFISCTDFGENRHVGCQTSC
jgi:hypothetical protein